MSRRVSMARKQRNESARPRYACMMLLCLEAVTAAITEDRLWFSDGWVSSVCSSRKCGTGKTLSACYGGEWLDSAGKGRTT